MAGVSTPDKHSQALCIRQHRWHPLSHTNCAAAARVHAAKYLLQVVLHLWILHLSDPAIVAQLHSDDCNAIKLVDVVKLLVSSPLLRYQSLGTYNKQQHISNRR